jgi:general secretion pathway protein J
MHTATSLNSQPAKFYGLGRSSGFTLIELLVAIFIMSILAVMSWRGIDSMARAQEASRDRADSIATLQTALVQWQTDLDQMFQTQLINAVDFDGRVLRVVRRYSDTEVRIIGWTKRTANGQGRWLRWQSAPINNRQELQNAWVEAGQWGENPGDAERRNETDIAAIDDWQIYYYRNNAWTNAFSSAGSGASSAPPPPSSPVGTPSAVVTFLVPPPDGVRLILTLSQGQALAGVLTRDWIRPDFK